MEENTEQKGSFGKVIINKTKCIVSKTQVLYDNDKALDLCTITDACISAFASATSCKNLPLLDDIELDLSNNHVTMFMPYYGIPLHTWISKTSRKDRIKQLPSLVHSLADACNVLLENNITHTDIKPANILINNGRLTLIDFNIYSVKGIDGWVNGVGTWCYVAPEILLHGKPSDTSMVWSIGMVIADICGGYALGPMDSNVKNINERKDWQVLIRSLMTRHEGMPLTAHHYTVMPSKLLDVFYMCTVWDSHKRPSPSLLLDYLEAKVDPTLKPSRTPNPCVYVPTATNPSSLRDVHIDIIAKFCLSKHCLWQFMYRTIWLYDHGGKSDPTRIPLYICLTYVLMGYTFDDIFLNTLMDFFVPEILSLPLSDTFIEEGLVQLCVEFDWEVYDKGADMIAMEQGHDARAIVNNLPAVMKAIDGPYTSQTVANALLKAITTQQSKDANVN